MNQDLEPQAPAELQPMFGPHGYGGYNGGNGQYADHGIDDWLEPLPPFGPTDGLKDTIDRWWAYGIRPTRYVAIAWLRVTYSVWRFVGWFGTIGLIVAVIWFKM